jgi:bifunctional UDP-N-acetylglucosamine pyrophosphorylase/glucosamine-1-phosphate N-acetyltransferase
MERKLATIILAAGKGKRMKNPEMSKVMYKLDAKPMIEYVVELARNIDSDKIIVIVGHQKQSVINFLYDKVNDDRIKYAHQDEQLGTGHAVMQTRDELINFNGDVLILSGDVPLLKKSTIDKFLEFHFTGKFSASLISAMFENPFGYGRIIRDEIGNFIDIKEEKDADEIQKNIKEINSGIYLIDNQQLFEGLNTLDRNNSQGEYYLTDIFKYYIDKKHKIGAMPVENTLEITGINTYEQLTEMGNLIKSKI